MNPETLVHSGDVQTLRAAKVKRRLLEEQLRVKQLEGVSRRVALRESAEAWEWLDPYADILGRLSSPNEWTEGYLISTAADRRYGAFWPFWRSWQEHARLRAAADVLYTMSPTASGIIDGVCGYVINDGMKAKAASRPGRAAPPALVEACQEALTDFERHNEFAGQQQEQFVRTRRSGDSLLRGFKGRDGMLTTRVVGGQYLVEPVDLDLETQSYGIETDDEDTQSVTGYHVSYTGSASDAEFVPAGEALFFKANTDSDVKRGLTDLSFDAFDLIKSGSRLLENSIEGTAIQASIALVRQHEQAGSNEVTDFVSGSADRQRTSQGRTLSETSYRPGRIEDIPKGMSYVQPPFMANAQAAVTVFSAAMRGAGRKWQAPEWLISGDASNNNFASSLVAESPFSRFCSRAQGYYGPRFRKVYEEAIKAKCDAGKLVANGVKWTWEEVKKFIEVTVEPPTLQVRDTLKEAQESAILIETGISSRQKECQRAGNDWAEVERDNAEWKKAHPEAVQQPGTPGVPDDNPRGGGRGAEPGAPDDVKESLLEGDDSDDAGIDAGAIADIFYAVYGAKALQVLQGLSSGHKPLEESWDGSLHPRGKGGLFIPKGSAEAVSSATQAVHAALKGGDTDPETLMGHLSLLTVKQIREVAATHGHTAPKWLRNDLIKAVMDVVASHAKKGEKPQEKPAAPTPAPAPKAQAKPAPAAPAPTSAAAPPAAPAPGVTPSPFPPPDHKRTFDPQLAKELTAHLKARKLTPVQRKALRDYTDSDVTKGAPTFVAVNRAARGEDAALADMAKRWRLDPQKLAAAARESVKAIDAAMEGAHLPRPVLAQRGIAFRDAAEADAFVQKMQDAASTGGHVQMNGGFQSTTLDPRTANGFGSFAGNDQQVRLEILASRGLYVDPISENDGERELLLPRDAKYRVHAVTRVAAFGPHVRVIQLEQVDGPESGKNQSSGLDQSSKADYTTPDAAGTPPAAKQEGKKMVHEVVKRRFPKAPEPVANRLSDVVESAATRGQTTTKPLAWHYATEGNPKVFEHPPHAGQKMIQVRKTPVLTATATADGHLSTQAAQGPNSDVQWVPVEEVEAARKATAELLDPETLKKIDEAYNLNGPATGMLSRRGQLFRHLNDMVDRWAGEDV